VQLDRYREPLLLAAIDIAHRINNLRNRCFFETYLTGSSDDARSVTAQLGTLYRFAKYWATVESLYSSVSIVRFENDANTEKVARCLGRIGRTYTDDSLGTAA
jgi:hypothetical protein